MHSSTENVSEATSPGKWRYCINRGGKRRDCSYVSM
uniref:Uncharacterized protein n=1 Tax=Anguilla anguilla TaxID=7936 RepID=A0A0E9Y1A3_ANGAN